MKLKLRLAKLYDNGELKRKNTERVKDYFVIFITGEGMMSTM